MELLGLAGGQLALAFGIFGAGVVGLYLLKLRRRQVVVPYVLLWNRLLADKKSSALFSQMKRWWSLLLALMIVGLLVVSLGDPRRPFEGRGRTLVVLVDASASMQATDEDGGRISQARSRAREVIAGMEAFDRAIIAQLDDSATPLSSMTDDRAGLRNATDRIVATDLPADLAQGMAFALDVLQGAAEPEIVLVGDGGVTEIERAAALLAGSPETRFRYLRVGKDGKANVGLTAFSVRRYPLDKTQSEVLLRVRNYADAPTTTHITLSAGGDILHRQQVDLDGQGEEQVVLRNVAGADRTLEASLDHAGGKDLLAADDHAFARLPERQRMRVLLVSAGNRYLEAALLLDEYLEVHEIAPSDALSTAGYDVVIYDSWLPAAPPPMAAFYILPPTSDGRYTPVDYTQPVSRPFVGKVSSKHPVTRHVALRDINIGVAVGVTAQKRDRVLVASKEKKPLVVTGEREGQSFVALAFDPRASDLPMRVAFPLIVLNILEHLAGESADYQSSYRAGEPWKLTVPDGVKELTVGFPDGSSQRVHVEGSRASFTADRAGLYKIEGEGHSDVIAVNLARPAEGELLPVTAVLKRPDEPRRSTQGASTRLLWPWLIAAAIALLGAEWITFHRRWTV
jgi:Ca-activated chloride channel family protein